MKDEKPSPAPQSEYRSLGGYFAAQILDGFRLAGSQRNFDSWAATKGKWTHRLSIIMGALLLLGIVGFDLLLASEVYHDAPLLWWGKPYTAALLSVRRIKQPKAKYTLAVSYEYSLPDGTHYRGEAQRTDLNDPPPWKPGDHVAIRYGASNPAKSTIEYYLSDDVYRNLILAIFLLTIPGGLMIAMLWRYRKRARALRATTPST